MESNHLLPAYKVGTLTNELSFPNIGSEFEFCSECLIGKTVISDTDKLVQCCFKSLLAPDQKIKFALLVAYT